MRRAAIHQGCSKRCDSVSPSEAALLELPGLQQKGRERCTNTAVTKPGSAALLQAGDILCIATLPLEPLTDAFPSACKIDTAFPASENFMPGWWHEVDRYR